MGKHLAQGLLTGMALLCWQGPAFAFSLEVQGHVSDPRATVDVKVDNGSPVRAIGFVSVDGGPTGSWSAIVNIGTIGPHLITATGHTASGDTVETSVRVEVQTLLELTIDYPPYGALCSPSGCIGAGPGPSGPGPGPGTDGPGTGPGPGGISGGF